MVMLTIKREWRAQFGNYAVVRHSVWVDGDLFSIWYWIAPLEAL